MASLDVFIQVLNIAKDACRVPPVFGSTGVLLTMIRVRFPLHSAKTRQQRPTHRVRPALSSPAVTTIGQGQ